MYHGYEEVRVSLYLISKDHKLRSSINRQLKLGCVTITNLNHLDNVTATLNKDADAILLIDEKFSQNGLRSTLRMLLQAEVPGKKIILTNEPFTVHTEGFVWDGTYGFLSRTASVEQLIDCVVQSSGIQAIRNHLTESQIRRHDTQHEAQDLAMKLVGKSSAIRTVRTIITRVAPLFSCVHIEGETGTGKEVVAQLIRERSGTPDPFVEINCAAIPQSLADTHLFGSERGAYTDAKEATPGYISRAHEGILFLDELEDLHTSIQSKLLRLLETHRYRRVGSMIQRVSKFRLITASNIPLHQLIEQKKLRQDLYYRLNKIIISIPPLRERKEDIPLLISHFLTKIGETRLPDDETLSRMINYSWPGNVRELYHELERLSVFAPHEAQALSFKEILTDSVLNL